MSTKAANELFPRPYPIREPEKENLHADNLEEWIDKRRKIIEQREKYENALIKERQQRFKNSNSITGRIKKMDMFITTAEPKVTPQMAHPVKIM